MFSKNIKKYRKANNLTQAQLAQIIGVSRTTISAWENNQTEADFNTLRKLKEYFNISYEKLLD